jgi:signal transduction histidine kinase/ActR/RegA family two-component response regulator
LPSPANLYKLGLRRELSRLYRIAGNALPLDPAYRCRSLKNPTMIETEKIETLVSRLPRVTSLMNRARTPQELATALVHEEISRIVPFDYCSLVLPAPEGTGIHVWRACRRSARERLEAAREAFEAAHDLLKRALSKGASLLIPESDLEHTSSHGLGEDARSALALPLSFGGECFGLLCFASRHAGAFASDDAERLEWLADAVAAVAQAILSRAHARTLAEKLEEMENLKSGFVHKVVRDMRFPLTNVLGLLELFESKLHARESFDTEDRQLLMAAIESGDRMRGLLDNLVEIVEQKERPLRLEMQDATVEKILEEVAEPLRGEAALRGVELNVRIESKSLSMRADERQARRALHHLLAVALSSTPDGGAVHIEAQSIQGARMGDDGKRLVVVNIIDSGQGIPAEEIPFVFDPFWQSPQPGRNSQRSGLGLAIARRIAAAHGGNISVRSQSGVGTTYSIVFPAAQATHSHECGRILIVDDVPELLLLLRKLVVRMGYEAETASDGFAALRILRQKSVDLVLTDWAMPGMNGGELITAMKRDEQLSHIPTIVLTGHDTDEERREAARAGCDYFLVKPVKRDDLQRTINELLTATTVAVS